MPSPRKQGAQQKPDVHSNSWRSSFLVVLVAVALSFLFYSTKHTTITPEPNVNEDAFEVVDLPGRGKGVIALRDIKQGDLLIREKPLFIIPRVLDGDPRAFIAQKIQALDDAGRAALYNLSYVKFPSHLVPEEHPTEVGLAIIQTNAVAAGDGIGLFPRMARLNHGCSSAFNAVYSWRATDGEIVVHALKDIVKGQEILTVYTDTKRPRSERRDYLSSSYDFDCMCAVCSLPEAQSLESDRRLIEMSGLYNRLATWGTKSISGSEAIEIVRQIWALGNQEGYWSERGQLAADAAQVASAHSDGSAVRAWAREAMKWFAYELGEDDVRVEQMRQLVLRPEEAGAWGTRARLDVGGPGAL